MYSFSISLSSLFRLSSLLFSVSNISCLPFSLFCWLYSPSCSLSSLSCSFKAYPARRARFTASHVAVQLRLLPVHLLSFDLLLCILTYQFAVSWLTSSLYPDLPVRCILTYQFDVSWLASSLYPDLPVRCILTYQFAVSWLTSSLYPDLPVRCILTYQFAVSWLTSSMSSPACRSLRSASPVRCTVGSSDLDIFLDIQYALCVFGLHKSVFLIKKLDPG